MDVVFINCTGETFTPTKSGAICTWLWELCHAARRTGIEPLVITRTSDAPSYQWGRKVEIEYPRRPTIRGTGLGRLIELQRRLTGWGHVRQRAYSARIVRAIRTLGMSKAVFLLSNDPELAVYLRQKFPHAFIAHHFHNQNPCSMRFRRRLAESLDLATAVSDFCGKWNQEYFALNKVHTIYNGVDTTNFRPAGRRPDSVPIINFVGRTDHSKAPDLLLRAAQRLSRETNRFAIQILGSRFYGWSEPDDYQCEIQKLSDELEEKDIEVRRPGFIDRGRLPAELRKAEINVVPSRWDEPFGLVTVEGMASGLATVASRTGGTPEVVGDSGFLFTRDSVDELTDHLRRLLEDEDLRATYAIKARIRAEEFTWDHTWAHLRPLLGI